MHKYKQRCDLELKFIKLAKIRKQVKRKSDKLILKMLGLISMVSLMMAVSAQYTCPPYQVGTSITGSGLGGVNGLYQATSLAQCCYNCLVVFKSTCAGWTYNAQRGTCFLASSIQYYQNNMGTCNLLISSINFSIFR